MLSVSRYIWLLLCYAQFARSNLLEEYEECSNYLYPKDYKNELLPIELPKDKLSGCICRATAHYKIIVCFGNYECVRFPKVTTKSEVLRVRTTAIKQVLKRDLDSLYYLKVLELEANHQLKYIETGAFSNLTNLEQLSISYNSLLLTLHERIFEGLQNLHNLTLVNNGFQSILDLTPAFKPSILPSLRRLDVSENNLGSIPEDAFSPMEGTYLRKLDINLCSLDWIHPKSFLPLKHLKELHIGNNDLYSSLIGDCLLSMMDNNINLLELDLSGLGFRKHPPRDLMTIVANSTIQELLLIGNQFEMLSDDSFPQMVNIEYLDLRKVQAVCVGPLTFDPEKFPNLKYLILSGNNLPGIHAAHLSNQLLLLDLSDNRGQAQNPVYYDIDRNTFIESKQLQVLNLAFNRIRSLFDYSFVGLDNLVIMNLENGTIFHIGNGTFKATRHLEMLNLANNPLAANTNLSAAQFQGLSELKVLVLENCGIKHIYSTDNIFEMMPNITHLVLRNNQIYYITAETLKPLKMLKFLDLSENLLISWWKPLFLAAGVQPTKLYLMNNKISHFSVSMIRDIDYLLKNNQNGSVVIDLMDNVFVCDCTSMYTTYSWLQVNGSKAVQEYIYGSNFQCSSPDLWEDRRVAEYLTSIKSLRCLMYQKITGIMVLVWTAPSLVTVTLVIIIGFIIYKYRMYIRYWIFVAKIALGKNIKKNKRKPETEKVYKYDAFISYSNEDREFVHEMINQLEGQPPYLKLCVYERDFEIGSFISEAVADSINQSRYIVLIISNSFAKSHWCRWETQLAEYHRIFLEDGIAYDPIVLVRIGEIQSKYLTTTLKYLLKTKIYHQWEEKNQEDFWKKLRDVIKKSV